MHKPMSAQQTTRYKPKLISHAHFHAHNLSMAVNIEKKYWASHRGLQEATNSSAWHCGACPLVFAKCIRLLARSLHRKQTRNMPVWQWFAQEIKVQRTSHDNIGPIVCMPHTSRTYRLTSDKSSTARYYVMVMMQLMVLKQMMTRCSMPVVRSWTMFLPSLRFFVACQMRMM